MSGIIWAHFCIPACLVSLCRWRLMVRLVRWQSRLRKSLKIVLQTLSHMMYLSDYMYSTERKQQLEHHNQRWMGGSSLSLLKARIKARSSR